MKPFARRGICCLALIVILILNAGCAGRKQDTPADAPANSAQSGAPVKAAQSVQVTPGLDLKSQVRALIPEKGGEVTLTLANGLVYTLRIPTGALVSDQEVIMTPIRRLEGMPLSGGLIAGVQLEPDGTELLQPATLSITLPDGYDLRHMVGFGYHGQGTGFYLSPAQGDGKALTIQLMSFSGHGAASGSDQEVANQAGTSTGSAEDDFNQQMAQELQKAKSQGKMPESEKMVDMFKTFFDQTVYPDLQAASTDDTRIDAAGPQFLRWWRNVGLLGVDTDLQSRIDRGLNMLIKGLKNAFDKAAQRCVSNQDISESGNMLKRLKELALLGGEGQDYTLEGKEPEFQKCLRFTLNFDSRILWEIETNMNLTSQVTSNLTLKMDTSDQSMINFTGRGELEYKDYSVEFVKEAAIMNNLCQITTEKEGGYLNAYGRIVWYNLSGKNSKLYTLIALAPSTLYEKIPDWQCTNDSSGEMNIRVQNPYKFPMWSTGFDRTHQDQKMGGEFYGLQDPYIFSNFEYVGGQVIGRETGSKSKSITNAKVTDDYTIDIIAAPGAN